MDINAEKLDVARGFGATDVIDASTDDPVATVHALTGGGVDAAFEAIGLTTTADQALAMIRPGRTAYLVGVPPIDSAMSVPGAFMVLQAKGLQGLFMGNSNFKVEMPNLARHYQASLHQEPTINFLPSHPSSPPLPPSWPLVRGTETGAFTAWAA